eukprot:TRINITY_DN8211_c0_g1_i9.p1 TRINITY_DN8211_c0_g1~~TRINITY_DN8211_c0_g1_i9.p1  ORF type:complete len:329 (-),score=65.45 TRINITY_DN8211_c0_g1_i9:1683-2669(-)
MANTSFIADSIIALKRNGFEIFDEKSRSRPTEVDGFKIRFSMCGVPIVWDVILSNDVGHPPDFILCNNLEHYVDVRQIPSLMNWSQSPTADSLVNIVKELKDAMKASSRERILALPVDFLHRDLHDIFQLEQLQLHIQGEEVGIEILFEGLFNSIPRSEYEGAPLVATFTASVKPFQENMISTAVRLPANLSQLSPIADFPTWKPETPFCNCLESISKRLFSLSYELRARHEVRIAFFREALKAFPTILEYDSQEFNYLFTSMRIVNATLPILIHFVLPSQFPSAAPELYVSTMGLYRLEKGAPKRVQLKDYPYSPRWSGIEMVARIR